MEVKDDAAGSDKLCTICFETIQPVDCSVLGTGVDYDWQPVVLANSRDSGIGTALKRCKHWFCQECWRHHLVNRVRQGDLHLECPVNITYICNDLYQACTT